MKYKLITCLLLLCISQLSAGPAGDLQISAGWFRAMPPGSKMTAAYAQISNVSDKTIIITGFSSPQYHSVSLHQTLITEDGMSKMQEIPQIILAAGQSVLLEPGGKHLMLMSAVADNPTKIDIIIQYNDNDSIKVEFNIENRQ